MALFGGNRDIKLFNTINRELINDVMDLQVDIYKPSANDSNINLYGEATRRVYLTAVRVACLIDLSDQDYVNTDFGVDVKQNIIFYFLKDILQNTSDIVVEPGDVLNWDESYWEIDTVKESEYFLGKNPDTDKGNGSSFGSSVSIVCDAHLTRKSSLSLVQTNVGLDKILPRNI